MEFDKEELLDKDYFQVVYNLLQELSESASTDELTKILNRRAGKRQLEEYIDKGRSGKKVLSICLYDINELKKVNDTYGHKEGDRLLEYTSSVVKKSIGKENFIFRLSGDEFVIVFYGISKKEADVRMQEILKELKEKKEENGIFYEVSFCYGITELYPGEKTALTELLAQADDLMYIQKRAYHIRQAKLEMQKNTPSDTKIRDFEYDKDHLYEALCAGTDDYIFVGNMKTGMFRYPAEMVEEFGLPGEIVENAAAIWSELIHPHDADGFLESNQDVAEGRVDSHNIEYRARNVRGEWIWLRCRGKMIPDENGVPYLFAGMITNLGMKNQIDRLTGLYNRFVFEGCIKKYLVDEKQREPLAIMVLDMDSFRNINDLYNYSFGDEVLRITAQKIESILPAGAKIYRLGGDEFGIIISNGGSNECKRIFKRIQHTFEKQQQYNGKKYFCTLSAGMVICPKDADNYLDLVKYANYSLEASKAAGKNRLVPFSRELLREKERKLELTELLRESIERGFAGFAVHYQPQVHAETGEIYGAEALARWKCDKYGEVGPNEFIPILENNGLIVPLGAWIFEEAVRMCKKWCEKMPDFHISINLSYRQLLEGDILSQMDEILAKYELNPGNVIMELTETYLAKAIEEIMESVRRIHTSGMHIAMDDFGEGYSSMSALKTIPVDVVKIDKSFMRGIASGTFNEVFIRSITKLCHAAGKKVCLEGVETEEEYAIVKEIGQELIQGYYFGRPVDSGTFEKKYFSDL